MRESIPETCILIDNLSQAQIYYQSKTAMALVLTKTYFVPIKAFKEVFLKVSDWQKNIR